jgi:hypothetical protein
MPAWLLTNTPTFRTIKGLSIRQTFSHSGASYGEFRTLGTMYPQRCILPLDDGRP